MTRAASSEDGKFVVQAGLDGMAEMTPAAATMTTMLGARPGYVSHVEADFQPAPDQHAAGKGGVSAGDGCIRGADDKPVDSEDK